MDIKDVNNGLLNLLQANRANLNRLGKEYGVPTPYNEFLYHAIRVLEAKNAGTVEGV